MAVKREDRREIVRSGLDYLADLVCWVGMVLILAYFGWHLWKAGWLWH